MISIPQSPQYEVNERKYGMNGGSHCIVCNKPINVEGHHVWVRIYGGSYICHASEAEAESAADCGYYPVGKDCLKKHPELQEYVNDLIDVSKVAV